MPERIYPEGGADGTELAARLPPGMSVTAGNNYTDGQRLHQNARFGTATRTCRYARNLAWPQGSRPEELAMDDLGPW